MLRDIIQAIIDSGGRPFEVGGCVRDRLQGLPAKDLDIEVFALGADELASILSRFGRVNSVGVSFGVIKLRMSDGTELDFSLPRRESKIGQGHRGFRVEVDPSMTVETAAARRDFTINAIYRCAATGEIHDPFGGSRDLEQRRLRATSSHFAEDALRVLRGVQFAARFDLVIDEPTAQLCRSLLPEYPTLAIERIWGEWQKWTTRGVVPSRGLEVLAASGWLQLYPELVALPGVRQDAEWHPEGDAWIHTLHVCDAAARIADRDGLAGDDRTVLLFAALCHDLGKATTTGFVDGRWRAHGHCEAGAPLARSFLASVGCPEFIIAAVEPLVVEHLVHARRDITPRAVRRLAQRLAPASISQLVRLIEADMGGRPPLPGGLPPVVQTMIQWAQEMDIDQSRPKPIILGRHLIALGHRPGAWFGDILARCFEGQLDGEFTGEEEGVQYLRQLLENSRLID